MLAAARRVGARGGAGRGAGRGGVSPPPASQVKRQQKPLRASHPPKRQQYVGGPWTFGVPQRCLRPSRLRPGTQAPLGPPTGT